MRISLQTYTRFERWVACLKVLSRFYASNKDTIWFNKNLFISGICSLIVAAAAAEYIYDVSYRAGSNNVILITLISIAIEYVIETPIFIGLSYYYYYRKHRYKNDPLSRKTNSFLIANQIKKLLVLYSISDALYFVAQTFILVYLLQISLMPYQAVIYSSLLGWAIYFLSNNALVKIAKFM